MDAVVRAGTIYVALLIIFRLAGRRTLSQVTPFDFVLLLIIGGAAEQAMLGDDFSLVNAVLVVISLIFFDVMLSLVKRRSPWLDKLLDGEPMIVVEYGRPLRRRIDKARISESDILEAARNTQGLEKMEQIRFAILEKNGHISIIPDR